MGQAADMREYADFLDDSSDGIAEIYATKAGGTTADWRATMTAKGLLGQWYTPQEAVDAGLVDASAGKPPSPSPTTRRHAATAPVPPVDEEQAPAPTGPSALQERRHRMNARKHAASR
jgi:hypothetical protein